MFRTTRGLSFSVSALNPRAELQEDLSFYFSPSRLTLCRNVVLVGRHGLDLTGHFLQSLSHLHLERISSSCQLLKDLNTRQTANSFL